jgi:hypothetical protein
VEAKNIRGPIKKKKWVRGVMYVNWIQLANYDFGVSSDEAVHSLTG